MWGRELELWEALGQGMGLMVAAGQWLGVGRQKQGSGSYARGRGRAMHWGRSGAGPRAGQTLT